MNAVTHLQANGEQTADEIAVALGVEIEHAYLELVRAEAAGLVRVNVEHRKTGVHRCSWEAMNENGATQA